MSDEQNQKHCCCKILIMVLTILSFALSVAALTLSILTYNQPKTADTNQAQAEESAPQVVISKEYDKGQSLKKAQATKKPIIVFFYTDWCGFCQKFAPTYDKVANTDEVKKNFAIAYVNCEKEENQKLAQEYSVNGYPTVFVIDAKGTRTQLDNNIFFNDDSVEVISKKALELIK